MAMKQKVRDEWCDALLGGKFLQGSSMLRDDDVVPPRYCCLGVLCEVLGVEYDGRAGFPGPEKDEATPFAGLTDDQAATLASMNDGSFDVAAKGFREIAAWIEQNVEVEP